MNEEQLAKFNELLRGEVATLEIEREELEKKVSKITKQFNVNDIQKLDKLAKEISCINHTISHLYMIIGSMYTKLK